MINGQCTYSIKVPPNSAFYLSAGGQGRFACTSIGVSLTGSLGTDGRPIWHYEDGQSCGREGDVRDAGVITASAGRSRRPT